MKKSFTKLFLFKMTILLSLTCGCGASAAVDVEGDNSVSISTEVENSVDSEYALSETELKDMFSNAFYDEYYYYPEDDNQDYDLSYSYDEENGTYLLTATLTEDTKREIDISVYADNSSGNWQYSYVSECTTYSYLEDQNIAIKEVRDPYDSYYVLYDRSQEAEISDHYYSIWFPDSYGVSIVCSFDYKYGFISSDGSVITPAIYDEIYNYGFIEDHDAAIVKSGSVWGMVDHSGEYIIQPQYYSLETCGDYLSATNSTTTYAANNCTCMLLDWDGSVLIDERSGDRFIYYESGYYVRADESCEGRLYDADFKLHDFTEVYEQLKMTYKNDPNPIYGPDIRCSAFGWNLMYTGGYIFYILNDDMNLVTKYECVKVSAVTNPDKIIVRVDGSEEVGSDLMIDHDGNVIMVMPQESFGYGRKYSYNSTITDYYAFGDANGKSDTISHPFFCIYGTGEIVEGSEIDHIDDTECVVVKLQGSSLYCVYDKGVMVKDAYYTGYYYDYETKTLTLTSDSTSETYIPEE